MPKRKGDLEDSIFVQSTSHSALAVPTIGFTLSQQATAHQWRPFLSGWAGRVATDLACSRRIRQDLWGWSVGLAGPRVGRFAASLAGYHQQSVVRASGYLVETGLNSRFDSCSDQFGAIVALRDSVTGVGIAAGAAVLEQDAAFRLASKGQPLSFRDPYDEGGSLAFAGVQSSIGKYSEIALTQGWWPSNIILPRIQLA